MQRPRLRQAETPRFSLPGITPLQQETLFFTSLLEVNIGRYFGDLKGLGHWNQQLCTSRNEKKKEKQAIFWAQRTIDCHSICRFMYRTIEAARNIKSRKILQGTGVYHAR